MSGQDRSAVRGVPGRGVVVGFLLAVGSTGAAHAAGVVEGMSDTAVDTQFANLRYRCEGQSCRFEALLDGVSRDDVTEYEWRFGDGQAVSTTTPIVTHEWTQPGQHSVELLVHDQYCDPLVAEASFATLAPVSGPDTGQPQSGDRLTAASVRLGQDATRLVSEPFGGATTSGEIFVFVGALEGARQVAFSLLGPDGTRNLRVEKVAPFDLAGGSVGAASPFDTRRLVDGAYRLEVAAEYVDGGSEKVSLDFRISNQEPEQVAEGPSSDPTSGDSPTEGPDAPIDADEPTMGAGNPDVPDVPDASGDADTLLFSVRADRRDAEPLAGASVTGQIYPYLYGAQGADSVRFFLDDPTLKNEPLQVEGSAPWDAMGGSDSRARPLDTGRLSAGRHVLSAEVVEGGQAFTVHASFDVGGQPGEDGGTTSPEVTPPAGTDEPSTGAGSPEVPDTVVDDVAAALVFSTRSDRAGGKPLAEAVIRGRVYPYLDGADEAKSVQFFLDDPTLEGKPLQVEGRAPWDAMGGSARRARPLDTRSLSEGRHVLSAKVIESGRSYVVHAGFTVSD